MKKSNPTYCGFATIVGKPNVGKSTLLNHILGFKLSITSAKPQTTRHRLLGITSNDTQQVIYVDTPGLHQHNKHALNRYLNQTAQQSLHDLDMALWVVDCQHFDQNDAWVLEQLAHVNAPIILILNKIDKLHHRNELLTIIESYQQKIQAAEIIPISALNGEQVTRLTESLTKYLPESPFLFPKEQVSDCSEPFFVAEIIREKLMRSLAKELPYRLTVTIEAFAEEKDLVRVSTVIWVEKASHKPIVIGKKGDHLKKIGKLARHELEKHFGKKVYLQLWVKVKSGWTDDSKALRQLGYHDDAAH